MEISVDDGKVDMLLFSTGNAPDFLTTREGWGQPGLPIKNFTSKTKYKRNAIQVKLNHPDSLNEIRWFLNF
jgi:hypothetical protein